MVIRKNLVIIVLWTHTLMKNMSALSRMTTVYVPTLPMFTPSQKYNDSDITSVLTTSESHGFSHGENVPNDYVQVLESSYPVSLLSITN